MHGPGAISFSLPSLLPPAAPPSPVKGKKSPVIIASFKEKPITGRGELSSVLMHTHPGPKQNLELNLDKEFPDLCQDPLGFAKESELSIWTCQPRFSNLYQLIHLLASESKERE